MEVLSLIEMIINHSKQRKNMLRFDCINGIVIQSAIIQKIAILKIGSHYSMACISRGNCANECRFFNEIFATFINYGTRLV